MNPPDVEQPSSPTIVVPKLSIGVRVVVDGAMIVSFIICALWINSTLTTLELKVEQLENERISDSRIVKIEDHLVVLDSNMIQVNASQHRIEDAILDGRKLRKQEGN